MTTEIGTASLGPALQKAWEAPVDLALAVPGSGTTLYGITGGGKVVALDTSTGQVHWQTDKVHLRQHLTVVGNKVYCYQKDKGLMIITDSGATYSEEMFLRINPTTESYPISNIVVDGDRIAIVINEAVFVLSETTGDILAGGAVGNQSPHTVATVGADKVVVIDGYGQPQLFVQDGKDLRRLWYSTPLDPGTVRIERPVLVHSDIVICGTNTGTVAYRLTDGSLAWQNRVVRAQSLIPDGEKLYAVGAPAHAAALNASTGQTAWARMYLYETTVTDRIGAALKDQTLYVGAFVASGGPIHLFGLDVGTGGLVWQGNTNQPITMGLPCPVSDKLVAYGSGQPAVAFKGAVGTHVRADHFTWSPLPLRGPRTDFSGQLTMNLPVSAFITVRALREQNGPGTLIQNHVQRTPGTHTVAWNAGEAQGFSDDNQFGRLSIDVEEAGVSTYTITKLLPVNTLPDLLGHWAQKSIETMIYHKYIGGYPDLTFRPDNLVSRAESSTIIAKTLGLEGPTPGFATKFTDIATHWARNYIMALEEKGIISGFQEADGTFTFRPEVQMTRAQEARILVRAYVIPAAPEGFTSRFTDIAGHWAATDIKALESAGYVTGFREANGTYTYRPEQNLTRAELSTMVVRIRKLER